MALQHFLHADHKLCQMRVQTENKHSLQNHGGVKTFKGACTVGCTYNRHAQRVAKSFLVPLKHSNVLLNTVT